MPVSEVDAASPSISLTVEARDPHLVDVWYAEPGPAASQLEVGAQAVPWTHRRHPALSVAPDAVLVDDEVAYAAGPGQHGIAQILPARARSNVCGPGMGMPGTGHVVTSSDVGGKRDTDAQVITGFRALRVCQFVRRLVVPAQTRHLAPARAGVAHTLDEHLGGVLNDQVRSVRGKRFKCGGRRAAAA